MADGSVVFEIKADASKAQRDLEKVNKEIDKLQQTIDSLEGKKNPLVEQAEELSQRMREARAQADEYGRQWASGIAGADVRQGEANKKVQELNVEYQKVVGQIEKIDNRLLPAYEKMDGLKEKAGEAEREIADAATAAAKLREATATAQGYMDSFVKRVKNLAKRVFVFTVITMALRAMRAWLLNVIKSNDEATAAMARLKGALLTLAQPLVDVIIPAFITFANILTSLVGKIASVVAAIFGTTAKNAADSAEALYEQTEALKGTGAAANKAARSLAAFDEINVLSQETAGGGGAATDVIAPDFSWADGVSGLMADIADDVLTIGAGLALWRVSSLLPGTLGLIMQRLAGLVILIGGVMLAWDGLADAWQNGVNWGNFLAILAGIAAEMLGLWLLFGNIGLGIGLVISGIAALIVAFRDMVINGMNVKNVLLAIAGLMAAGIGIGLLTGNWIPLLIAGIASIVLALVNLTDNGTQLIENLKQVFFGFVEFINGLVTGDINQILEGLKNMVKGAINTILTVVGSLINAIIRGLNWLIDRINSISFEVPEWVPGIGGRSFSPRIGRVSEWNIPQLATGAVIPPNREFMAILGDQKNGTNIEAPLDTIVAAFENVMARNSGNSGGDIVLQIDGKTFARLMNPYTQSEQRRRGVKLVTGGV